MIPQNQAAQFETLSSLKVTHNCLQNFTEPQSWSSREAWYRATPQLGQRALKGLSVVTSSGPSSVDVGVGYCWRKQSCNVAYKCGKQEKCTMSSKEFRVSSTLDNKKKQPQTEEQRAKRDCALTARKSISKAMKRLVGGAAAGTAEHMKQWTTALIPRSSGRGTHSTEADRTQAARAAW